VPATYIDQGTRTQVLTDDVADETPGYGFGRWIGQQPSPTQGDAGALISDN
jgi:hypothetical protein